MFPFTFMILDIGSFGNIIRTHVLQVIPFRITFIIVNELL